MAKKTEVARWKSIMTKLDYKMTKEKTKEKLERAKIVKNTPSNKKGKRK